MYVKTAISVTVSASAIGRRETTVRQLKKNIMETDYKKKYEEALGLAKSYYGKGQNEFLDTLFPELRESEDERIINQLITLVNSTGEILLIPTNKEELIAWLNKCKESLHVSETCKENADSFTDEDERIRKELLKVIRHCYEDGGYALCTDDYKKYSDYLEKQKENIEKEYVFRPLAGTDINSAALQAIRRANEGDNLVLAFNGAYIPVRKGCNANKIVDIYEAFIEKQKEQKLAEWSEEDEVYLQDALWCVKQAAKVARGENDMGACWSAERWLKSFRPQKLDVSKLENYDPVDVLNKIKTDWPMAWEKSSWKAGMERGE